MLDGSSYAGDARIDNVPPGQERLLSYGIDLQMTVDVKRTSLPVSVTTAKIVKGILMVHRHIESAQDYSADNKGTNDKTLIIEHPVRAGWKLVDSHKPIETTANVYRFKGDVPAEQGRDAHGEGRDDSERVLRDPADGRRPRSSCISAPARFRQSVRDAIAKAVTLKNTVSDVERQMAARTTEINGITVEQNRMRENMRIARQTRRSTTSASWPSSTNRSHASRRCKPSAIH